VRKKERETESPQLTCPINSNRTIDYSPREDLHVGPSGDGEGAMDDDSGVDVDRRSDDDRLGRHPHTAHTRQRY